MPSGQTGPFILKPESATVSWTGSAISLTLGAFGDRLVALSLSVSDDSAKRREAVHPELRTYLDVSFATESTAGTMWNPHHCRQTIVNRRASRWEAGESRISVLERA